MLRNSKKNPFISIVFIGIMLAVLLLLMFIPTLNEDSEVAFEVNRNGRFTLLDFEPIALLDHDWELTFWSIETSEGEGEYQIDYYPFIASWKLTIYDFNDDKSVANQDYTLPDEEMKQPYSKISISLDDFTSDDFEKEVILMKLRIELFIVNRTITDRIDFNIQLEGEATSTEYGLIMGIPAIIITTISSVIIIQAKVDKHFMERVSYFSLFYKHLWLFIFNKIRSRIKWVKG